MNQVQNIHGKPIDLMRLKERVLSDLEGQSEYWSRKAGELRVDSAEVRSCPVCGGCNTTEAVRIHDFGWRQCADCTHVFNGLRPSAAALARFYEAADDTVNHADDYTNPKTRAYRKEQVARPKVEFVAKYRPAPGRWLDVGSGNGDLLSVAAEMGYHGVGLEPNHASAQIGRDLFGLEIHETVLAEYAKGSPEQFDVVSFIGLLDLVEDPVQQLRDAAHLLKPGGVVVASFPNFHSLSTAVQGTYPNHVICRHMYPATLNAYTVASAERAFRSQGLEPVKTWFFGMDVYETINNLVLCAPGFAGSPLHKMLLATMSETQAVFDRLELCDKFHAIARKPG